MHSTSSLPPPNDRAGRPVYVQLRSGLAHREAAVMEMLLLFCAWAFVIACALFLYAGIFMFH